MTKLFPPPIPVKELEKVSSWLVPGGVLLLTAVLLPTYFETTSVVRKSSVTFVGAILLFALPGVARFFPKNSGIRRLAIQSLHAAVCITLWLLYGEMWEGSPQVSQVHWWIADGFQVLVGILAIYTLNANLWVTGVLSLTTGLLLVLVPVSRSTDGGPSPLYHVLLYLLLWYVEMALGGVLYSGVDFIYLFLACLPALRVHLVFSTLYTCILVSARIFEFANRWTLLRMQSYEQVRQEEVNLPTLDTPPPPPSPTASVTSSSPLVEPPPPPPPPPAPDERFKRAMARA